jgi:hypothetical protein
VIVERDVADGRDENGTAAENAELGDEFGDEFIDCGEVESDCGEVESDCGEVESDCGEAEADCGEAEADCGEAEIDGDEAISYTRLCSQLMQHNLTFKKGARIL